MISIPDCRRQQKKVLLTNEVNHPEVIIIGYTPKFMGCLSWDDIYIYKRTPFMVEKDPTGYWLTRFLCRSYHGSPAFQGVPMGSPFGSSLRSLWMVLQKRAVAKHEGAFGHDLDMGHDRVQA